MATLTQHTIIESDGGGEALRLSFKRTISIDDIKHDILANIPEDNNSVTLYTQVGSPIPDWAYMAIMVDPDGEFADGAAGRKVTIEITGDGTATVAFVVRGETPLILGADDIGVDKDNVDEEIDTIIAKNTNAVGDPAGSNDVKVRILLFGTP